VARAAGRTRLNAPERRTAILDAAQSTFGQRGYHGTSIDDVAHAAGISKALIYEHFASKRELHAELVAAHAGELFRRLQANANAGTAGEARMRGGVDIFFAFVEENPEAWRVLFRDAADEEIADITAGVQAQALSLMVALSHSDPHAPPLRAGETAAEHERSVEQFSQLLSGAVQALANWWYDHPEVSREELVERVMQFAWTGLERQRGPRTDPG
jgi:AcrR family transcriptional regulator